MDGFQGAILRVKLRNLEQWTEARRAHAAKYDQLLADAGVRTPNKIPLTRHVYHVYGVYLSQRDSLQEMLQKQGIQTGIHYPIPVHLQPAYADLGNGPGDFPCSEKASKEELSLPMFAELTDEQIKIVGDKIQEIVNGQG